VVVADRGTGALERSALGELHLDRCVKDLRTRFARVDIKVSPPILNFMETVLSPGSPPPPAAPVAAALAVVDAAAAAVMGGTPVGADGDGSVGDAASVVSGGGAAAAAAAATAAVPTPAAVGVAGSAASIAYYPSSATVVPEAGVCFYVPLGSVLGTTPERSVTLRVRAAALPDGITRALEGASEGLRAATAASATAAGAGGGSGAGSGAGSAEAAAAASAAAARTHAQLAAAFTDAGGIWPPLADAILAAGPKGCGPNILVATSPTPVSLVSRGGPARTLRLPSLWQAAAASAPSGSGGDGEVESVATASWLAALRAAVVQGFQLATGTGPLCGEPLWGVAFLLDEVRVRDAAAPPPSGADGESSAATAAATTTRLPPLPAGALIPIVRDACRTAFQAATPRLVEAMFACELACSGGRGGGVSGEQLGKLYGVLARRRGEVVSEDMTEGTQTFLIHALLPVVESFGFADDLRKRTSGAATSAQLLFSHWVVMPQDPFFTPTTDKEREEYGDTVHEGQVNNIARKYMDAVRTRKGMPVEKQVVKDAEKQRNLGRKK